MTVSLTVKRLLDITCLATYVFCEQTRLLIGHLGTVNVSSTAKI